MKNKILIIFVWTLDECRCHWIKWDIFMEEQVWFNKKKWGLILPMLSLVAFKKSKWKCQVSIDIEGIMKTHTL